MAASAALHALVLVWLGWSVAPRLPERPDTPSPPAVLLRLERLPRQAARRAPTAVEASAPSSNLARRTAPPAASAPRPAAPVPSPLPTAPATAGSAAGAAPGGGGGAHPGPMPAGEPGADLRGLLRATVGCSHADYLHLSDAERTRCDRGFATAARTAPKVDAIAAEKRAYLDAVVKAYAKMRAPTPVSVPHFGDNYGVEERWAGPPGAHMPAFGCKIAVGPIPRGAKSYHDKPPHSLKLGRLPCFVTPPSGFATEEADVEAPASLRERTDDAAHAAQFDAPRD